MSPLTSIPELLFTLAGVSTVAVGLTWFAALSLRRKSAALRHFFWLLALSAPLLALPLSWMHGRIAIPILSHALERVSTHDLVSQSETAPPSSAFTNVDQISAAATPASSITPVAQHGFVLPFSPWIAFWSFGAVVIIIRILYSQLRVKRLLQNGCSPGSEAVIFLLNRTKQHFKFTRRVRLMVTPLTEIPFCHGVFQPTVIFPDSWHEWDDERIEVCLTHELAHIIRGDLLAMALAQVTCILCWFNPLVWFATSKLRDEAENSADDLVLARNIRPETYAANLVAITEKYRASALPPTIALSMARPNRLKSRVEAILDSTLFRKAPSSRMIFCTGLLAAIALIAGMSVRLTAAQVPADAPTISSNANPPTITAPSTANNQPTANQTANAHDALDKALVLETHDPCLEFSGQGRTQQAKLVEVERLLQIGADPNAKEWGHTALEWALNYGSDEVATALIKHGADFNIGDQSNPDAAWIAASMFYCPNALELMIKKGVTVTGPGKGGGTILHHIASASPLGPSHPSYFNGVAYSEAMQKDYEMRERRTVDLLVAAGVDLNAKDNSQGIDGSRTPLMTLLRSHHLAAVRALIDHGADLTLRDAGGNIALATLFNWPGTDLVPVDIIETMLTRGVDPNSTVIPLGDGPSDAMPAMELALTNYPKRTPEEVTSLRNAIGIFLKHGALFPKVGDDKVQALLKAAAQGDLKSIQNIVQQGTSINSTDGTGWTALTLSTALSFTDCAQWLLNQGADITIRAKWDSNSALALAVQSGQADLVDALLAKGPKPNPDATKILWLAVNNKDQLIFDRLIKAGADPKGVDVLSSIKNGQVSMAKTALDAGADPNHDRNMPNNQNLAFWAVYYNQPEILKALLDHGADPSPKNSQGDTALSHAQKFHKDMVPMLEEAVKRPQNGTSLQNVNSNSVTTEQTDALPDLATAVITTSPPVSNGAKSPSNTMPNAVHNGSEKPANPEHTVQGRLLIPKEDAVDFTVSKGTLLSLEGTPTSGYAFDFKSDGTFTIPHVADGVYTPVVHLVRALPGNQKALLAMDTYLQPITLEAGSKDTTMTANLSGMFKDIPKGSIQVGLKILEIDDDVYQTDKDKINTAVENADIGFFNNLKGASMLSTPSVTTRSGLKANINIVREFPYPTSFESPKVTSGLVKGNNMTLFIPPTPREFVTKDVGVSAEITPTIDASNSSYRGKIILNGKLTVTDF